MSIQRYENSFDDPIYYVSQNIQGTVYDGHGGYDYPDYASLNAGTTSNDDNETTQYHVMTTVLPVSTSASTLLLHPKVYL